MNRSLILIFLLFSTLSASAQWLVDGEVISALGLHAERPKIKISTTFGEAVIFGRTDGPVLALQGFQRNRSEVLTNIFQPKHSELQVKVYPNPCHLDFQIEIAVPYSDLKCYHMDGRLMAHWPQAQERYPIAHLPKGVYVLRARTGLYEQTLQTLIIQ